METVEVPKAWLESLLELSEKAENTEGYKNTAIVQLIGFSSSAKALLKV
jgi:hypothetical protein